MILTVVHMKTFLIILTQCLGMMDIVLGLNTLYLIMIANIGTWLSLFISCGDKYRNAIAADCATILTELKAEALATNGYKYIGRYLTGTYGGGINKALSREGAEIILEAGLKFFPIYQDGGTTQSDFTAENGQLDGEAAVNAAKALGLPDDTIIYFAVDFDAMDYQITSNIIPYFKEVYDEVSNTRAYKVGVYGARNVCSRVSDAGYACSSFVGNMSTGFSGNLGFKMPSNWAFDQFGNKDKNGNYLTISSADGYFEIDKDGVSGRDDGVSWLKDVEESDISDKFDFGGVDEDEISGPVIDFFGNKVPLFKLDIAFIDLYIANYHELSGAYLEAADINQDGLIDDSDYQLCIDISALKVGGY